MYLNIYIYIYMYIHICILTRYCPKRHELRDELPHGSLDSLARRPTKYSLR